MSDANGPIRTRREGAILEITLDRPKANAIDLATSRVMGDVFREFRDDDGLRVAILRAAGEKFFCAGWSSRCRATCSSRATPRRSRCRRSTPAPSPTPPR